MVRRRKRSFLSTESVFFSNNQVIVKKYSLALIVFVVGVFVVVAEMAGAENMPSNTLEPLHNINALGHRRS